MNSAILKRHFVFFYSIITTAIIIITIIVPAYGQNTVPEFNSSLQSTTTNTNTSKDSTGFFVFFLILLAAVWIVLRQRDTRHRKRRDFPADVKKQKLSEQNYKCAICKRSAGVWDYDHIDGNRSNNKSRNLQVLCPNCHAKKSRGLLKQEKRFSIVQRLLIIIGIVILFYLVLKFMAQFKW
jgi:flagellar biogenesis protein FliO